MTSEDKKEMYDRMRKDEMQTSELRVAVSHLTDQVKDMAERWDRQVAFMWKLIYILIGTLVAVTLSPKMAEKLMSYGMADFPYIQALSHDHEVLCNA